ncbi:hypothetical protein [Feifania hominis]|uniref:Uncharacterized protein n=1 Tax=Feifania hominis TaxID=2763660 RepID=A0A926HUZ0_9FIRM|nr:hypothetical protein [Feifania hominis]MBC8536435.1 hypothetical protein [Feifania hominis]
MYELLEISESAATRFLTLKNMETNTVEECFDDSALVSDKNFEFMKTGRQYDCKIKLFGTPVNSKVPNSVNCKILDTNVVIGNTPFVEVIVNKNKYYIVRQKAMRFEKEDFISFLFTRKDLIQVDSVIHPDL